MEFELEAVAFDIDGTIYPEWKFHLLLIPFILKNLHFMKSFGKVRRDIRQKQKKNDAILSDFFDEQACMLSLYIGKDKEETKKELQDKIYDGWKSVFSKIKPYRHVLEVVAQLKKRGFKTALLSDFLVEQKNDVWGILPLCDVALSSEQVGALKPSPYPFLALANALKIQPSRILYVGNNLEYDVKGASAIGMRTAMIDKSPFSFLHQHDNTADIVFSDYRQLLSKIIEGQENKCWIQT